MNLWKISIQNLKQKPWYTVLNILMLSLSITLLFGMQQLKSSFAYQMENNLGSVDMVVGAKGSPLQLVLASVLHLDNPTGNISYAKAKEIANNPSIKKAVPISYGDNYKGYRIVGTTPEFLDFYGAKLKRGRLVGKSMEVIIGATVAQKSKLSLGDTFLSSHGLTSYSEDIHEEELVVVGILETTQNTIDRLIITNLESIWDVHNHEDDPHEEHTSGLYEKEHHTDQHHDEDQQEKEHHEEREITSLLVDFKNPRALLTIPRNINTTTEMQAALPKFELQKLYQYTGIGFQTISWIAYSILFISGMSIFISLYKMIQDHAFDLALMRMYGANNIQLIKIVSYEGFIIVCLSLFIGFFLSKAILLILFSFTDNLSLQYALKGILWKQILQIITLIFCIIFLSIGFAIHPITKMNISNILSNEK